MNMIQLQLCLIATFTVAVLALIIAAFDFGSNENRVKVTTEKIDKKYEQKFRYLIDDSNFLHERVKNIEKLNKATKPLYEADGYADGELVYDTAICPNCGRRFDIDYEEKYNYCPDCGQRIDWKVEEQDGEKYEY